MTPGGLPQRGDVLVHTSGQRCTVVVREGNDAAYSLILKPDGRLPAGAREAYGHPGCFRLLEAGYWLGRTYQVVQR